METIRALVIELDGAAGVELSRRALQLEKELGVHELIVSDSRRFLRELAKSELP